MPSPIVLMILGGLLVGGTYSLAQQGVKRVWVIVCGALAVMFLIAAWAVAQKGPDADDKGNDAAVAHSEAADIHSEATHMPSDTQAHRSAVSIREIHPLNFSERSHD